MSDKSKIEWTDATWNPTRGCSRISPGCVRCYAEAVAARFSGAGKPYSGFAIMTPSGPRWTGKVELIEKHLNDPLRWRLPRLIFVNSMSDLFHEDLPFKTIDEVFTVMVAANWHVYQVLTKRATRMAEYFRSGRHDDGNGPDRATYHLDENIWLGVSVEGEAYKHRIDELRETPAALRFLSIEPLLEDIGTLDLRGIGWVIVGGESGPGARRFDLEWMQSIVQQCREANVPVFCKQIGSNPFWWGYEMGRAAISDRKGGEMSEWPENLRVRQMPAGPGEKGRA